MKAVAIEKPGGPEVLKLVEVKEPKPQKGEVRIKVKAAGVNRADLLQRKGHYPPPAGWPADIPGLEFAGVVDELGVETHGFSIGQRVFGLCGGGAYAQYIIVHAGELNRMPDHLTFEEAAAVPEAFITAYDAMVSQGRLTSGETVLINAVGSGVGIAALQIAKVLLATTIGTSRSEEKLLKAKEYGLDHAIAVKDRSFKAEVLKITEGRGVDLVLELVGGPYLNESVKAAAPRGRVILVGLMAGASTDVDLASVLTKRLELRGTTLRARPLEEKIQVASSFTKHVVPLFEQGLLKAVVDKVMPLSEAASAHRYLENNANFGKVVLQVD